jgi:predicted DNA-binding transcriptional regulator AlpA
MTQPLSSFEFLRAKQILARYPISKSTLYRWVKQKRFPAPFKIGPSISVWDAAEIKEFFARRHPTSLN